jgi:Mn2+/Fe2+ NRAMP family transporter
MGKYTNSHWFNFVAWGTALIVIAMSAVMFWNQLHGG